MLAEGQAVTWMTVHCMANNTAGCAGEVVELTLLPATVLCSVPFQAQLQQSRGVK